MARPFRKLPKDYLERLEQMSAAGLSIPQMAQLLGISKATLDRRLGEKTKGYDAVLKGRAKSLFNVGRSAYQQAISGKNTAMTIFYLKCRGGWREDSEVEAEKKEVYQIPESLRDDDEGEKES